MLLGRYCLKQLCNGTLLVALGTALVLAQDPVTAVPVDGKEPSNRCKVSQLIGCTLTNSKNETLGSMHDLVLDHGRHRIAYAVVVFGGVLGLGSTYVAMPWPLVEVDMRGREDTPRATIGLDPATLKAAPGFDKLRWPNLAESAWTQEVDDYYRRAAAPNHTAPAAATTRDVTVAGTGGVSPGKAPFVYRRLSHLVGTSVVDRAGRPLAEVEDVVVNPRTAVVEGFVLSTGGFLGMGERIALVPVEALTLDGDKGVFVMACSPARLQAMALPGGVMPPLDDDRWLVASREQCAAAAVDQKEPAAAAIDASAAVPPAAEYYDTSKVETVTGTIRSIGSAAGDDGMARRLRLRLRVDESRDVTVHAAPTGFAAQDALALAVGMQVTVVGAPKRHGLQTVLLAASLAVGGKVVALRDAQGLPLWGED
jgi:sporulation protein YlmC with PRC-barrel domain